MPDNQACVSCGIEKRDWAGNGGKGYAEDGQMFCCYGCASDLPCTCVMRPVTASNRREKVFAR